MINYFYIYLSTPDYLDPLFRAKVAGFAGYYVSLMGAAGYYGVSLLAGVQVPKVGISCIKWILKGTAVGVTHATASYASSRFSGDTNHWGNHLVGGIAAGIVSGSHGPPAMRLRRAIGFGMLSIFTKAYVDFMDKHPNFELPRFGEHNPSPYLSLNHRWMNPQAKEQERELERVL
ncbi:hypothetical protein CSKR_110528 [Clonorchis sinensis]|uniref:Uncharacterized protein n=2 Tax=Clonorchis sinensis TaxID=79923 RepID=A0A8T1M1W5_CLOSI|nr:hypothetical protein CSKR_110528 [Clonorchis sinensis]GAA53278.1 hypothetical protein CLF_109931 [Clonorchis sinensis]